MTADNRKSGTHDGIAVNLESLNIDPGSAHLGKICPGIYSVYGCTRSNFSNIFLTR